MSEFMKRSAQLPKRLGPEDKNHYWNHGFNFNPYPGPIGAGGAGLRIITTAEEMEMKVTNYLRNWNEPTKDT